MTEEGGPFFIDDFGHPWFLREDGKWCIRDSKDNTVPGQPPIVFRPFPQTIDWISVEEELPDKVVSVCISAGGVFGIGFRSFDSGEWVYNFISSYTTMPVSHWTPLPSGVL